MKQDRRIQRTQTAIREAFISLVLAKGYVNVSIQDIVNEANIGRTTFYAHYSDKEELLDSMLLELFTHLKEALELENPNDLTPARGLLEHLAENRNLSSAFDFAVISSKFHNELVVIVKEQLKKRQKDKAMDALTLDIKTEVVCGGLMAVVNWWLKSDVDYSAEEIAVKFNEIVEDSF